MSASKKATRSQLLVESANTIDGDRNVDYGDPIDDFSVTAKMWEAYLQRIMVTRKSDSLVIEPHDVAVMMMLVKVSRLTQSPAKKDHWLDIAGYAGCGWECVTQTHLTD